MNLLKVYAVHQDVHRRMRDDVILRLWLMQLMADFICYDYNLKKGEREVRND